VNLPGFAAILFAVPREGKCNTASPEGKCNTASPERWIMAEQIDWSKMLDVGYFRDRTVLMTGASSGIGRDIAMSLSRMGAQVAMPCWPDARHSWMSLRGKSNRPERALALGADVTRASEIRVAGIARSKPLARSISP
jgi:short chain dehydrogenase